MRRSLGIWVAILWASLVGFGVGAGPESKPEPKPGDLGRLQGRWEAAVGRRGEFVVALQIKGNEVEATIAPRVGPKLRATGEVQLDESASPRSLDWVKFSTLDGAEVPEVQSIYRIEGDKLILRTGGFNNPRPRSFDAGGEGIWSEPIVFTKATVPPSDDVAGRR